ncbi:MAG: carbohydrate ABC transporter permease [Frankia sp.]
MVPRDDLTGLPRTATPWRGRRSRRRLARDGNRLFDRIPVRYAALAAIIAGSAFPLYWTFVISSQGSNSSVARNPPPLIPSGHFFANVSRVFRTVDFAKAMVNSLIVSGSITVSVLLFCSLAGFAFAKLRFRGRGALFLVVVATMMVPTQLGVIPLYIEMGKFGWTSDIKAVTIPFLVTAFGVFWMRQYVVEAVPDELLDAARSDGCTTFGLWWHVVAPALRPAAAVLGLFTFMQAWNDFFWPLIVLTPQDPTVQVSLENLAAGRYTDYTLVLAATAVGTLPVLVVFVLFGRQIIGGIMEGAVKG